MKLKYNFWVGVGSETNNNTIYWGYEYFLDDCIIVRGLTQESYIT